MKFLFPHPWKRLIASLHAMALVAPGTALATAVPPPARVAINFPFHSPESTPTEDCLRWLEELGAAAMRQMIYNDVHWNHIEPTDNAFDFTASDAAIRNSHGITALPTLYSMMGSGAGGTVGLQVPWRACTVPPFTPACGWRAERDAADSEDYVRATVARYRDRIRFWEVANEMNGATNRPKGLPVGEFAQFLTLTRSWARAEDPQAQIVLPGLLGTYGFPFSNSTNWLDQLLAAGGGDGFDVANYHDYNSWWTLPLHYDQVRATLNAHGMTDTPIWVTETGISSRTYTPITPGYSSPEAQAADVWRRLALLYGKGAALVAWHSHYSTAGAPDQDSWDQYGLLDPTGKKKKSWHAMKLLIAKLEGFKQAQIISLGTVNDNNTSGGNGVWVVRFQGADDITRHVMWSPDGGSHTLTGLGAGSRWHVTHVVPATISADGHTATFDTSVVTAHDGESTFALGDYPILVEPVPTVKLEIGEPQSLLWRDPFPAQAVLESSSDLTPLGWSVVPASELDITTRHGAIHCTHNGPAAARQFFRLRWTTP